MLASCSAIGSACTGSIERHAAYNASPLTLSSLPPRGASISFAATTLTTDAISALPACSQSLCRCCGTRSPSASNRSAQSSPLSAHTAWRKIFAPALRRTARITFTRCHTTCRVRVDIRRLHRLRTRRIGFAALAACHVMQISCADAQAWGGRGWYAARGTLAWIMPSRLAEGSLDVRWCYSVTHIEPGAHRHLVGNVMDGHVVAGGSFSSPRQYYAHNRRGVDVSLSSSLSTARYIAACCAHARSCVAWFVG